MSSFEIGSRGVEQTISFGKMVAPLLAAGDVIVLCGDLGAGKTHFSKGVAEGMGISDEITSPTFNILRMHDTAADGSALEVPLAHWDIYRLDDPDQLEDVDYYGVIESSCVSLVEWGDKFPEALPEEHVKLGITLDMTSGDDARILRFEGVGPRGCELVDGIRGALGGRDARLTGEADGN